LRWAGVFTEDKVCSVSDRLQPLFQEDVSLCDARDGVVEGQYRVRPLLCCPPVFKSSSNKWCLIGEEIFRYAHKCFNPREKRESCSTRYNFQQWGVPFTPVVTYLKDNHIKSISDLENLYRHLGAV